jgi:hypothetical protein
VRNTHTFALNTVIIRDEMPTQGFYNERTIIRRPAVLLEVDDEKDIETEAVEGGKCVVRWTKENDEDEVDGFGKQHGLYEWVCTVGAGERIVLEA